MDISCEIKAFALILRRLKLIDVKAAKCIYHYAEICLFLIESNHEK